MSDDLLRRLAEARAETEEHHRKFLSAKGASEALMKKLEEDFGVPNLEAAYKKLDKLQVESAASEKRLRGLLEKLEAALAEVR